ncbi:MAG: hypothetical protein HY744_07330 [Deltaproteobacteria bacterium]|nr:hypothetical protein [Deltaproteobacteria bacterium]
MRVLLVGVGCVGKTTIGRLLAARLGVPFFDLDEEIEKHFGASVERLRGRFLTDYSYRKETSVVLGRLLTAHDDCVVASVPSGLRDAYLRVVRRLDCVTVAIEDAPENILQRITFYDVDSQPIEKRLTDEEKRLYRREIRKDITFFGKTYRRADLHADIAGLDAEAGATLIVEMLGAHVRPGTA